MLTHSATEGVVVQDTHVVKTHIRTTSVKSTCEAVVYSGSENDCNDFAAERNNYPGTATPIPGTNRFWVEVAA
jgi:hypothetical protein